MGNIIDELTLKNVTMVAKRNLKQGESSTTKNRWSFGFSMKKTGRTVYTQDGKRIVSDENHVVFLPKGADYSFVVIEAGDCIVFEVEFDGNQPFDKVTSFPITSRTELFLDCEKAERAWTYKKPGYRHKSIAAAYNILSKIISDESYVNSKKFKIIEPSVKYMELNLSNPDICTENLAEISGISVPYFRKIFFEIYKMPVAKYIEMVRMRKAQDLLKSDFPSVSYVAESVGYRNIYHFSKVFKKFFGISPSEFARNKEI